MGFGLSEVAAKLANFNARSEMHGEDRVPAADLKIEIDCGNLILNLFDDRLRAALYDADPDGDLLAVAGHLPRLRFAPIGAFAWNAAIPGAIVHIVYLIDHVIVLGDCIIDHFVIEPRADGHVALSFRIRCHPDELAAGKLCSLVQSMVGISVSVPPRLPEEPELPIVPDATAAADAPMDDDDVPF